MKAKYKKKEISLVSFGLLAFLTILLSHTELELSKDPEAESPAQPAPSESVFVWTYKNAENGSSSGGDGNHGCILKASIMVTSIVLSVIATFLLLFGAKEFNPYYFLPWLILTLRGLATVQVDNLLTLYDEFMAQDGDYEVFYNTPLGRKYLGLYSMIIIFNIAECLGFYEVLDIFRLHWQDRPYLKMLIENRKKSQDDADDGDDDSLSYRRFTRPLYPPAKPDPAANHPPFPA